MGTSLRDIWRRVTGTFRRDALTAEVDEEFRFHLEQATERNIARGMSPEAARRAAIRSFGSVAGHRDAAGDELRSRAIEGVMLDVRLAFRTLRRSPGFAVATTMLVALGIGANTAIFSVVNGVLLKPLPFADPGRMTYLGWDYGNGRSIPALSFHQMSFLRDESAAIEAAATWRTFESVVGDPEGVVIAGGIRVSQDFFQVTRRSPLQGRGFSHGEHLPNGPDVAIVSAAMSEGKVGAKVAPGGTVRLDGRTYTVVGVMPAEFHLPGVARPIDLVLPLRTQPDRRDEGQNYTVLARLRETANRRALEEDLAAVSRRFGAAFPELAAPPVRDGSASGEARFTALRYEDVFVGNLEQLLWVLFGAVGFVTLIVCVNAANLMLGRASARGREMAVRAALGAGRGRIVRQLLVECLVVCGLAGAIGLVLGLWGVDALLALAPHELPRVDDTVFDWRVASFTGGVTLAVGLAVGLAAALTTTRGGLLGAVTRAGRGHTPEGRRVREALIVFETGMAVVLLSAAGLLINSFARLAGVDPGFDPAGVVTARVTRLPAAYGEDGHIWEFERRVLDAIRTVPGVEAAAAVSNFPLERGLNLPMSIEGRPDDGEGAIEWRGISEGYFETLRVPLRGRGFTSGDHATAPRVGIVNAALAARYWPGEDPIGKRVELGRFRGRWLAPGFEGGIEIVGVAGDVREIGLANEPRRTLFVPRAQWSDLLDRPQFVVRTNAVAGLESSIGEAVRSADPRVPPPAIGTLQEVVRTSIARQRFQAVLLGIFGASALLLTAIGIYGVMAFNVARRTREIGVRMALGARRGPMVGMVVRRGMVLVVAGAALGLGGSVAATRLLGGMLYKVSPTDPMTLCVAIMTLAGTALAATLLPAWRAARVNPTEALRAD